MSDAFEKAVQSQKEQHPPKGGHMSRRRPAMFSGEGVVQRLRKERLAAAHLKGFTEIKRRDGTIMMYPIADCVRYPNNTYYPVIEFLCDHLGADYVTKRFREAGVSFTSSKATKGYLDVREDLLKELAHYWRQDDEEQQLALSEDV